MKRYRKFNPGGPITGTPPLKRSWPDMAGVNPAYDFSWMNQPFPLKRNESTLKTLTDQYGAEIMAKAAGVKPGESYAGVPAAERTSFSGLGTYLKNRRDFGTIQAGKMGAASTTGTSRFTPITATGSKSGGLKLNMSKMAKAFDDIKPYASNIVNAFRRPPLPATPGLINPVTLPKVSLNNARNVVERNARSTNMAAERMLDENTAASVQQGTLATKLQGLNDIADREAQINAGIGAQQAQMNLGVETANVGAMNNFRDSLVNRKIAMQREQSANLSNAVDKNIAIDNERAKGKLDLEKMKVLSDLWRNSGVYDRMLMRLKKSGMDNVFGVDEKGENTFRKGGKLKKVY